MSKNQLSPKLGAASRAKLRSKALPGSSFSGLNQAFKMVCPCCSQSAGSDTKVAAADPAARLSSPKFRRNPPSRLLPIGHPRISNWA